MFNLLAKLLLSLLAFPPLCIAVKYWRWCARQEKKTEAQRKAEAQNNES